MLSKKFPKGFLWGVSSSAPQTESRKNRGVSNWDIFIDKNPKGDDYSNKICTEFEERYEEDIKLLKQAGIKSFRFSISWPRIQPAYNNGSLDKTGVELYNKIINLLIDNGIEPIPTIFHWDIPDWAGDFRDRNLAYRFAEYALKVTELFSDRVKKWIIFNEPSSVALLGYGTATFAPGIASKESMFAAIHHVNLAQGLAFKALRTNLPSNVKIGTTLSLSRTRGEDDSPENIEAARKAWEIFDAVFLDPLYGKGYPQDLLSSFEAYIKNDDMDIINSSPDFLGINYYCRLYVKADSDPKNFFGFTSGQAPKELPKTQSSFVVEPDGLTEILLYIHKNYNSPDIYITETGFALDEPEASHGVIDDSPRSQYIYEYLDAALEAISKGVNLLGLSYWAATDNWEWTSGLTIKFGLIRVEKNTLLRTPKKSLAYYSKCINENSAVEPDSEIDL
ncbi:family 1 glycosylhydrolase [Pantoea sp. Bo_2]|uniref:glycoside hydrolase family 1 protein n=1 Tax=unclassified Pantoea TaxID=2630326 RepID=UPI001231FA04|nr:MULTISPECIES: family 1 glycosylhydrolase [unclassified Pantoea]KAA5935118.1 family 1 glycosylhydrolase [Pantoea sp. VH_3]KAA5945710.1 family 1 glycosylhydrolase [Pantoea sp. VH_25]KAA5976734.1 family 1 glycosylhydrolase [Pantoea sp. M_3]KAA6039343.1 family 1 glycosylhydrolase [Pantoea sp. FN_2b]KAA6043993.1 family 1 glycosylhydrolase [Pantoea sp. Bo_5]